jgi:hypothetical protein
VLLCRERVERRPRVGDSAVVISGADEHQASVHLQMSTEPGQRCWQGSRRLILSLMRASGLAIGQTRAKPPAGEHSVGPGLESCLQIVPLLVGRES